MGENDPTAGEVDGGVPEGLYATEARGFRRSAGSRQRVGVRTKELQQTVRRANETFVTFVRERPLTVLGAAVGIGYVFGRIFRRVV